MSDSILTVGEYGRIFLSDVNESLSDGNLKLGSKHFKALLALLETDDEQASINSSFFTYSRLKGIEQLHVQNYVGVIRLPDGVQIEVLPKISRYLDKDIARNLLIKMLIELEDSPFYEGTLADLDSHRMPIFELLMRIYLDRVANIVRKGIARDYVSREDNLVFLRGKLELTKHIRHNSYNLGRVYCNYDEFDCDLPINRVVKGALVVVNTLTQNSSNQQRCRELLFWFDGVPETIDARLDLKRIRHDRHVQHYASVMPLCRLILESLNPLTQQGENQAVSMLFPMENVFESYVSVKLPKQFESWNVEVQVKGKSLIDDHLTRPLFSLRPDLLFSCKDEKVIADTKWKIVDQENLGEKYGVSQADVYQMFGYSRKYLVDRPYREVILIYPACDTFTQSLEPFWYREGKEVLHVVPFDLQSEELLLPDKSLLAIDSRK